MTGRHPVAGPGGPAGSDVVGRATPLAARIIEQAGLDAVAAARLADRAGTITANDVITVLRDLGATGIPQRGSPAADPAGGRPFPPTTDLVHLTTTCDASALVSLRDAVGALQPDLTPLSATEIVAFLVGRCVRHHPALNGRTGGRGRATANRVDLAVRRVGERERIVVAGADACGLEAFGARLRDAGSTDPVPGTFGIVLAEGGAVRPEPPSPTGPLVATLVATLDEGNPESRTGDSAPRPLLHLALSLDAGATTQDEGSRFLTDLVAVVSCPVRAIL